MGDKMTDLQDCRKELKDLKSRRYILTSGERIRNGNIIKRLEAKAIERGEAYNRAYDLVEKYKNAYEAEKLKNKELNGEISKLTRKVKFIHSEYEKILKGK